MHFDEKHILDAYGFLKTQTNAILGDVARNWAGLIQQLFLFTWNPLKIYASWSIVKFCCVASDAVCGSNPQPWRACVENKLVRFPFAPDK